MQGEPGDDPLIHTKAEILRSGVRISGATAGAALGQVFGPEAGAATAQMLTELGELMVGRLEAWEQRRVAQTLLRVHGEVTRRQEEGETVRLEIADPESEDAGMIFESVIDAAARSIEERKCEVISNLYTSIAFDDGVGISDALLYIRRVKEASWRQLVSLRYFEVEDRQTERELIGVAGAEGEAQIHPALGAELSEAARSLELIGIRQDGGEVANPSNTVGGGQISTQSAGRLGPTGLGRTISRLGRLEQLVTDKDLDEIARDLHREGGRSN